MALKRTIWTWLSLLSVATPAQAGDTASIVLRGYVPIFNAIELHDVNPIISMDLRAPIRDALVARIVERSNAPAGYTIKLISENGERGVSAALRNDRIGTAVPYSMSYGGQPVRFTNGRAELQRRRLPPAERTRQHELRISTNGSDRLPTGEYSDTLVIVVSAR